MTVLYEVQVMNGAGETLTQTIIGDEALWELESLYRHNDVPFNVGSHVGIAAYKKCNIDSALQDAEEWLGDDSTFDEVDAILDEVEARLTAIGHAMRKVESEETL